LSSKDFLTILGVSDAVFLGLMQNVLQVPCSFKVAIRMSWILVGRTLNAYREAMQKVLAAQCTRLT
jgi:hypothetical protein